mmetsp:Transcript_120007/g.311509  ORF Transcript_120007/g.311509 Transcript_120007/m.311509 type:complete len:531 (-) Transcript_120007:117-1709(-)
MLPASVQVYQQPPTQRSCSLAALEVVKVPSATPHPLRTSMPQLARVPSRLSVTATAVVPSAVADASPAPWRLGQATPSAPSLSAVPACITQAHPAVLHEQQPGHEDSDSADSSSLGTISEVRGASTSAAGLRASTPSRSGRGSGSVSLPTCGRGGGSVSFPSRARGSGSVSLPTCGVGGSGGSSPIARGGGSVNVRDGSGRATPEAVSPKAAVPGVGTRVAALELDVALVWKELRALQRQKQVDEIGRQTHQPAIRRAYSASGRFTPGCVLPASEAAECKVQQLGQDSLRNEQMHKHALVEDAEQLESKAASLQLKLKHFCIGLFEVEHELRCEMNRFLQEQLDAIRSHVDKCIEERTQPGLASIVDFASEELLACKVDALERQAKIREQAEAELLSATRELLREEGQKMEDGLKVLVAEDSPQRSTSTAAFSSQRSRGSSCTGTAIAEPPPSSAADASGCLLRALPPLPGPPPISSLSGGCADNGAGGPTLLARGARSGGGSRAALASACAATRGLQGRCEKLPSLAAP